jgi:[ribosomal protein S5]-alanine N-acetyltransferase
MRLPTLHTERLVLRPVAPRDEEAVFTLLSDERVVRHTLFPLFTRERAQRFVARVNEPPAQGEPPHVTLAIADRADDALVGLCGLVLKPEQEDAELWYVLRAERWGFGFASEAARALVTHAVDTLALHRVWASVLPENPASARVLEKLGFRREGLLRENLKIHGAWRDSWLYAVLAREWTAAAAGTTSR